MTLFFNMKLFKIFFLVTLVTAFVLPVSAQQNEGELEAVEIEIVKERQISLPKADRNFEKIPPRPAEQIKSPIKYDFKPFNFQAP